MTLYIGNLHPDCTEALLYKNFSPFGDLLSIRLHKDKKTGLCSGYGFINYASKVDAQSALSALNYTVLNGKVLRLMWQECIRKLSSDANVFVKNLDRGVDEKALHCVFSDYGNILSLKVAVDGGGTSKGFAFVQYEDEKSAEEAIARANGKSLFGKVMHVCKFLPKPKRLEPFRNIYIKNFDPGIDDSDLSEMCEDFGPIVSAKVMRDPYGESKCFGFVAFRDADSGRSAVDRLNGIVLNGRRLFVGRAMKKSERQAELFQNLHLEAFERYR